jgi:hypothetical protein
MIEFIPYMLIILWWHPDEPGAFELERWDGLFATEAECRAAGADREAGVEMYSLEHYGAKVKHFCLPAPSGDEVEQAFEAVSERHMQGAK